MKHNREPRVSREMSVTVQCEQAVQSLYDKCSCQHGTSNFFERALHGVFELHVIRIDEIYSFQCSSTVELLLVNSPMFFLRFESFSTYLTTLLAINNRAWTLRELPLISHPDHVHTFQVSSLRLCSNTSNIVFVRLTPSVYLSGIWNDSLLGT